MEFLTIQIIINALNLIVFVTLIIYTGGRKAPPLWLFAIIGFSVGMCIGDSIIRQSIWPIFTAVIMAAFFVITLIIRMRWTQAARKEHAHADAQADTDR